jgi:hypothetical protein
MPAADPKSTLKKEEEKTLLTWSAPVRPFRRWSRDFYVKLIAFAALFGIILYIIEGFWPVILIVSLVFLFYVMSTVEPDAVEYKITNQGIYVGAKKIDWELMGRFWFVKRLNTEILIVETAGFPGRLEAIIKPEIKKQIQDTISKYLTHQEVPPAFLDKASDWLTKKVVSSK